MAKPVATLKNWTVGYVEKTRCYVLVGEIHGHHRETDGSVIMSSRLRSIDFIANLAESKNCFYKLEDMAKA